MRGLFPVVAALIGIGVIGCATPQTAIPSPTGIPTTERPPDLADANGCRVTTPTTTEHPKDLNTAAFSRAWFVSADRLLWASATGRLSSGENKALWERPGTTVALTGRLWETHERIGSDDHAVQGLREGTAIITDTDFAALDARLRALAK